MTQTNSPSGRTEDDARGRITAEELEELWEEFENSAKPTSFDGDMEFFNIEDMQDQAYYLYKAAKSLLATQPDPLADPRVRGLVDALYNLHHAVCGETGFAACVRLDSGLAYPWPALDIADSEARAALAAFDKGGKDE